MARSFAQRQYDRTVKALEKCDPFSSQPADQPPAQEPERAREACIGANLPAGYVDDMAQPAPAAEEEAIGPCHGPGGCHIYKKGVCEYCGTERPCPRCAELEGALKHERAYWEKLMTPANEVDEGTAHECIIHIGDIDAALAKEPT